MIRPGERTLLRCVIGGVSWTVVESDSSIEPELGDNQGLCMGDRQVCYINRNEVPPEGYEYVIAHELAHATIFMTGGKEALREVTGLEDEDKLFRLEEYLVSAFFHSMWDTYNRNGWLRIPVTMS